MWSRIFSKCQGCGTDSIPHMAKGLCKKCYFQRYLSENLESIRQYKKHWHTENVSSGMQRIRREEKYFGGNREKVLNRDGYKCSGCNEERPGMLTVHHKDGKGRGYETPDNRLSNLVTLCRRCHARIHSTNEMWARHFVACIVCGKTDHRHNAFGYCTACYWKYR